MKQFWHKNYVVVGNWKWCEDYFSTYAHSSNPVDPVNQGFSTLYVSRNIFIGKTHFIPQNFPMTLSIKIFLKLCIYGWVMIVFRGPLVKKPCCRWCTFVVASHRLIIIARTNTLLDFSQWVLTYFAMRTLIWKIIFQPLIK